MRMISDHTATTAAMTTEMVGRYMRRSAAISVTMGSTLDVGARITNAHAPRNPHQRLRHTPSAVSVSRAPISAACGATSASDRAIGQSA